MPARRTNLKHDLGRTAEFQCSMCPSKFFTKDGLRFHIPNHVKEKRFKCTRCQFTTHSRCSFTRHERTVHDKSVKYSCSVPGCHFRTARPENLKRHGQTHESDPLVRLPFACTFPNCSYRGRAPYSVTRHIQVNHNQNRKRDIPCPLCPQTFWDKCAMRSHIKNIHTKEKDRKCSECDFVTRMSSTLQNHVRRKHGGYKPERNSKCELCFYLGVDKYDLNRHKIKFHEEEPEWQFPFECSVPTCDFRSRTKAVILKHERFHMSKNRLWLTCELCPGRVYPNWDSVRFHQWIEHDRKSHKCSSCNYVARKRPNLEKHVQFHHHHQADGDKSPIITEGRHDLNPRDIACKLDSIDESFHGKKIPVTQQVAVVMLSNISVKIM